MMRTALLFVLSALLLPVVSSSVSAQDAPPDPEVGDTSGDQIAAPSAELGGDTAPVDEAPAASNGKKAISVALLVGYGISLEDGGNPWGFGFGARGGYNIDKIYLGARFVFYLGEDPVNIWELGIEGGYDFALSNSVTLRPELGIGIASVTVDLGPFGSGSSSEFYVAPGASLLFDVTPDVFLGVDVRFQFILANSTIKGIPLLATAGMRF